MIKSLNRLPLRFSLPLVLLISFLFATLISLLIGLHQAREHLLEAASQHARAEAHRFARRAENELTHDTKDVRRMIMLHAAEVEDFNSTMTALLDPQGRVIYSFRSDWNGREFSAVHPNWDRQRLQQVQQGVTSDIRFDAEHNKLSVLTPYLYPRDKTRIASIQKGVVYVEYDLEPAYVIAWQNELAHHAPHLFAALLAFVLLAWWLRRNLYKPINELSNHTKLIGSGQLSTVLGKEFPSELRDLGHNLANMSEQLRREQMNLIQERDRSEQYLATVNAIVVVLDGKGIVRMINRKGCELLGWTEAELLGCNWFTHCLPQPQGMTEVYPVFLRMMAGNINAAEYFENSIISKDGSLHLIAWHNGYFKDEMGSITGTISSGEDISKRAAQEETLRKLNQAVEQSPESIVITDLLGNIEYVNESFVRTTGYTREEVLGHNPRMLQSGKTSKLTYVAMWEALKLGSVWQGEFINRRRDGSEYTIAATLSAVRDAQGNPSHYVAVEQDITARKQDAQTIYHLANFDALTELPNRAMLLDRIEMMLPFARRQKRLDALLVLNIDRFKTLNDARGQATGDLLLQAVALRIKEVLREGDLLARMSGDEFAILVPEVASRSDDAMLRMLHIAEHVHDSLRIPFAVAGEAIRLSASMGISLFPQDVNDTQVDILRRANTALHQAKAQGGGRTAFFEKTMDEVAKQRFQVERELRTAIPNGELRVFLQPQVDAQGNMVAAEALVRWQHPQRGLLAPGVFIAIAEESDLIVDLGDWMLAEVCRLLAREMFVGRQFRIAVNVNPRQFRKSGFAEGVLAHLRNSGAEASHLTLEVDAVEKPIFPDCPAKFSPLETRSFQHPIPSVIFTAVSVSNLLR